MSEKSVEGSLSITLKIVGATVISEVKERVTVPVGGKLPRFGQLPPPLFPLYSLIHEPPGKLVPDIVGVPQPSVAVAVPKAPLISSADGLQPSVVVVPPVVITGGVLSEVQVTVRDAVDVLPQASIAVHVLVCVRIQPLLPTVPSLPADTVGVPQPSVAVAVPKAPLISPEVGLQPSVVVVPPVVITGGVLSEVQVTVRDAVDVFPQASRAVHVLVCVRIHPLLPTVPSLPADTVGVPQPSVAVAVPKAPLISPVDGLQPSVVVVPPVVITGGVISEVHVTVRDAVDVFPQASRAVHVLVCVRIHPLLPTVPSLPADTVGVPQPSVAVAVPKAPLISPEVGLQPSVVVVPPVVITGGVLSEVQVTVRDAVDVLPQASRAVHVLVCVRIHPLLPTVPSLPADTVGVPQPSVAVAVPKAPLISPEVGLQPRVVVVPPVVITGAVLSEVHVTVRDAVDVFPQASRAVHVLVCVRIHPLLPTVPSLPADKVGVPQPSVAVAVPKAPLMSPEVGLQPSVVVVPPVVITGAVLSEVQVTVRDAVDVLPQASLAVHVLVCVRIHPLLPTVPSLPADTVGVPQPSVAVAVPKAPLISPEVGLQPSVVVVPPVVITGGVLSEVQVTVRDAVDVLPQPPVAVNVLVLSRLHPTLRVGPSLEVIVTLAQTSVAVIVPKAPSISAADGLHPRGVGKLNGAICGPALL